jgi:CHAT domain-containing protein
LYERVLAIHEKAFGQNHPYVADSLHNLAEFLLEQQRLSEALPFFERALTVYEEHLRQEVIGFSEARLSKALHQLRINEDYLYTIVRAHPTDVRVQNLALTTALLRKGRSVEELAATSRIIYQGLGPADRENFDRLRTLRTQYAMMALAGPGELALSAYQQRLQEFKDQADTLEINLARRSEPLRALHSLPPPSELLEQVAAALPKDGVLIEFVTYRDNPHLSQVRAPTMENPGELRYLALLVFPDGRTHALALGPAAPIDKAVQHLHAALAGRDVSYQSAAQELYNLAFHPLIPHLGKMQRVFLAPDGQLALVPFAALHDGKRFLVDTWDITYLTSGKDLLRRPEDKPSARSVVVLADPSFSAPLTAPPVAALATLPERSASLERFFSTLRSELANRPWPSLPGTQREAKTIQRLFPHAQLLLGPAATKEALLKLETPGVLHLATHGFFLENASAPTSSARGVVSPSLLDSGPAQLPPDPLLRSGLVLAGARAPGTQTDVSRQEDSLVTALELAGLNLWGTQLVVLSACDTGRGDVKLGQGVYGLRRALVVAGAETVVTSLWKVNDETTRELMEAYYQHLLAGQGRTTALREAMKELRKKKPHPYYWAPFIAIGQDAPLRGLAPSTDVQTAP